MLIKEYRIPLPLTVEEYRIAQLYMIAKKSREESCGEGSGIEILVNEPYSKGPGGSGQYTHKIYHVGSHLPGWLKALLPKSALIVEEEAWNAYPYTRTRYTCPFVEKFSLDIETVYKEDCGQIENVFNLNGAELHDRIIDLIDVAKDQLTGADYVKEEDPCLYVSSKTGRGPLTETWIQDYWRECKGRSLPLSNGKAIMCAYKLCRVEFKYWGMQAKIERFIHDVALRKTMLRAHRQAWAWQDEWFNLTMEDIREIERQTQVALAKTMGTANSNNSSMDKDDVEQSNVEAGSKTTNAKDISDGVHGNSSARASASTTTAWPISCISESSSDDEEFFDCQEFNAGAMISAGMVRWSSMELVPQGEDADNIERDQDNSGPYSLDEKVEEKDSIFSQGYLQKCASANRRTSRSVTSPLYRASPLIGRASSPCPPLPNLQNAVRPASALILVFHGGTVLDTVTEAANKLADLSTLRSNIETVSRQHFPSLSSGRLALRLVPCPSLCADAITVLSSLSPTDRLDVPRNVASSANPPVTATSISSWPPLGCLPLFAASSPEYTESVLRAVQTANQCYFDFLKSPEGAGFTGSVAIVADAVGSILLYDALCKGHDGPSRFGSENSIAEDAEEHQLDEVCDKLENLHYGLSKSARPLLQAPPSRRRSSCSSEASNTRTRPYLDFEVGDVFLLGSPLALVLAFRRWSQSHAEDRSGSWLRPHCNAIYNLFHPMDPLAARLEPLLSARFANTRAVDVPRYQRYPLGDGKSTSLADFVQNNPQLFQDYVTPPQTGNGAAVARRQSDASLLHGSNNSLGGENLASQLTSLSQRWWGTKRLDYLLYCPEGITAFPPSALPHLLHASFWESSDVAAFILRHIIRLDGSARLYDEVGGDKNDATLAALPFSPSIPCEKWQRKRTSVKIKNIGANHRANDVIVKDGLPQTIVARFMYGPLDMVALSGEKVDIHLLRDATCAEWDLVATEVTDKTGRLVCTLPTERTLGLGLHPVKMVVRGDHTYADLYIAVLPPKTQAVVFSIDGSFTASVSVTGRDPKVRAGAVDVVRHWQELGYLIIYITGRPDMQQRRVVSWLAQHNFPHGLLSFADGLSTDPLRHKAEYLKFLVQDVGLEIRAAYGSSKDIAVYGSVGLKPENTFINQSILLCL
nr:EOG090X00NX [Cyclestheria hislopi]